MSETESEVELANRVAAISQFLNNFLKSETLNFSLNSPVKDSSIQLNMLEDVVRDLLTMPKDEETLSKLRLLKLAHSDTAKLREFRAVLESHFESIYKPGERPDKDRRALGQGIKQLIVWELPKFEKQYAEMTGVSITGLAPGIFTKRERHSANKIDHIHATSTDKVGDTDNMKAFFRANFGEYKDESVEFERLAGKHFCNLLYELLENSSNRYILESLKSDPRNIANESFKIATIMDKGLPSDSNKGKRISYIYTHITRLDTFYIIDSDKELIMSKEDILANKYSFFDEAGSYLRYPTRNDDNPEKLEDRLMGGHANSIFLIKRILETLSIIDMSDISIEEGVVLTPMFKKILLDPDPLSRIRVIHAFGKLGEV